MATASIASAPVRRANQPNRRPQEQQTRVTHRVLFDESPGHGIEGIFAVESNLPVEIAEDRAIVLESTVLDMINQLANAGEENLEGPAFWLCQFALEAAQALRRSAIP